MKHDNWIVFMPFYLLVVILLIGIAHGGSRVVTTIAGNQPPEQECRIVIDPGHGGIDGGATSCTGVLESTLNLEISLRLNDLMHLLGIETVMIRRTDTSIHVQGSSIAAQKVSDLKERVRIVNETEDAVLVSIHQNTFTDSRYGGAQVFYANTEGSQELASALQSAFTDKLNPGSNRKCKKADGIYLMQHIECTGVLVECGFLSNPEEEAKLRSAEYQQRLCCVIAATISTHLNT